MVDITIDIDQFDAIAKMLKEGQDPWEALVSASIQAADNMDSAKWVIGDAALLVTKQYGKDRLGEFAYAINREKARVSEYRTVCGFWDREKSARAEILDNYPVITYTHLRDSMRLKDYEAAMDFIMDCVANAWGVEKARMELNERLGKPTPPAKLVDAVAPIFLLDKGEVGIFVHLFMQDIDALKLDDTGGPYRLVIYEDREESRERQPEHA